MFFKEWRKKWRENIKKWKSRTCCNFAGYEEHEARTTLIKLMKLTGMQNACAVISCAKNDSVLCKEMQSNNGRYGLYQIEVVKKRTDFLWVDCLAECNESILNKIMDSEPGTIEIYFSDRPIVSDADIDSFSKSKDMERFLKKYDWDCCFDVILWAGYMDVYFKKERFPAKEFLSEIESVIYQKM